MQWLFLAINLINMHFCRATWGRAVIGCGYGAPQPITALPQVAIYSLILNGKIDIDILRAKRMKL